MENNTENYTLNNEGKSLFRTEEQLSTMRENSYVVFREFDWLENVVNLRLSELNNKDANLEVEEASVIDTLPDLSSEEGPYADFIKQQYLTAADRVLLLLSLAPAIKPELFVNFIDKYGNIIYPELGGLSDKVNNHFIPTFKTFLYLLSGGDPETTIEYMQRMPEESILIQEHIVQLRHHHPSDNRLITAELKLSIEYVNHLLSGGVVRPLFNSEFPARLLTTTQEWEHLILSRHTKKRLNVIIDWVKYKSSIMEKQGSRIVVKDNFPVLFYGPPGTGKTMAASLIGKVCNREVYRIDLSMVVSKYIGETEKNLKKLFDKAEKKEWILFFDEADALFGKRGVSSDAHDKYANQEMAYLLYRIETYSGMAILATNLERNIDEAMTRRFQAKIYFGRPQKEEKLKLWQGSLPSGFTYAPEIVWDVFAEKFDLTGANIVNVIKRSCIEAAKKGDYVITPYYLVKHTKEEYEKENKIFDFKIANYDSHEVKERVD